MSRKAYLLVQSDGARYDFDGVTAVTHTLTLKLSSSSDGEDGADLVNGARNEPDSVTLEVLASDVHGAPGDWSRRMFRALAAMKKERLLLTVATDLRTYRDMLLSDFTVVEDSSAPFGWTGSLTFTKTSPSTRAGRNDNSSAPTCSGAAGTVPVLSPFQQLLAKIPP